MAGLGRIMGSWDVCPLLTVKRIQSIWAEALSSQADPAPSQSAGRINRMSRLWVSRSRDSRSSPHALLQPHKLLLICQSPSQSSPSPWRDFFLLPEAEHLQPLPCVKCGFRGSVCLSASPPGPRPFAHPPAQGGALRRGRPVNCWRFASP